jgi:hypothetical protein
LERLPASNLQDLVLFQSTLKMAEGNVLEEVIGKATQKALAKDRIWRGTDFTIHLETERSRSAALRAIFFCPFVSLNSLGGVIENYRAEEIVWVPWSEPEYEEYLIRYRTSEPIASAV